MKIPDDAVHTCPEAIPDYALPWLAAQMRVDPVILYKPGRVTGRCCTCGRQFRFDQTPEGGKFIFLGRATCPFCGTRALTVVETSVRSEADYQDDAAFFQAGTNDTVWLRQFHVRRDERIFEHDPDRPPYARPADWFIEFGRIALRDGAAALWLIECRDRWMAGASFKRYRLQDWERKERVYVTGYSDYRLMAESWRIAVAGTENAGRLRYLDPEAYLREGGRAPILYTARWAKYPVIEMLWKCGYRKLVEEKLRGAPQDADKLVNLRARSPKAVFRLPKDVMRLQPPGEWTYSRLRSAKIMYEAGTPLPRITGWIDMYDPHTLRVMPPLAGYRETLDYLARQNDALLPAKRMKLGDLRDYWDMAAQLGMDLANKTVLWPRDLRARHDAAAAEMKFRAGEAERKKMQARVEPLEAMAWAKDRPEGPGLLIRPARTPEELAAEGKALHHCVGTYSARYAAGETEIWFVRRAEAPEEPFFTLEYCRDHVAQCRTLHNLSYETEPAVLAFVREWAKLRRSGYFARRQKKAADMAAE